MKSVAKWMSAVVLLGLPAFGEFRKQFGEKPTRY